MIKKFLYGDIDQFNIGDEVEFDIKIEIVMGDSSWVRDPQYSQVVHGHFNRPGEKRKIRGKVTALSDGIMLPLVHVKYNNYIDGYEPKNILLSGTNRFCCIPKKLRKI